jgi:glutamate carboxypeptidase
MFNPFDPTLIAQLQAHLTQRRPLYLDLLRQMVDINSFTSNLAGVNALGKLTAAAFADLGFTAEPVQCHIPASGRHVVLTRPGRSGYKIGLVSHLDTVFPPDEEVAHNFKWRPEGDRLYGPGVMDIKGGTVVAYMMLAALQAVLPAVFNDITWVVLLNAAEETMAEDFAGLCLERLTGPALAALVFETGHLNSHAAQVVTTRKGMALYRVKVEGRGAHAGSSHPRGASAVVQLAHTIQQIAALTDYDRDITFNVGTIAGGTVLNRVPHYAVATGEMRAFLPEVYQAGLAQLLNLPSRAAVRSPADDYACQVVVNVIRQVSPWPRNPGSQRLLYVWQQAGQTLGIPVQPEARGGLSDGNGLWEHLPTLDGLGPAGRNAHCSEQSLDGSKQQEYALASSFVPKALLNCVAVLQLIQTEIAGL